MDISDHTCYYCSKHIDLDLVEAKETSGLFGDVRLRAKKRYETLALTVKLTIDACRIGVGKYHSSSK